MGAGLSKSQAIFAVLNLPSLGSELEPDDPPPPARKTGDVGTDGREFPRIAAGAFYHYHVRDTP